MRGPPEGPGEGGGGGPPRRRGRRGADKADGGPGCAEQRSDGRSERPRAEQRKEAARRAPGVGTRSPRAPWGTASAF